MQIPTLQKILTLEAIRVRGAGKIPESEDWSRLNSILEELVGDGLVKERAITTDGKKAILLARDTRSKTLKGLEAYREVLVDGKPVDARMAIVTYLARKHPQEKTAGFRENYAWTILWDTICRRIKEREDFAQYILGLEIVEEVRYMARPNHWHIMGRDPRFAERTCALLLNPVKDISIKRYAT